MTSIHPNNNGRRTERIACRRILCVLTLAMLAVACQTGSSQPIVDPEGRLNSRYSGE
jgi:hypothetical protein